jgi:hypothetical protein
MTDPDSRMQHRRTLIAALRQPRVLRPLAEPAAAMAATADDRPWDSIPQAEQDQWRARAATALTSYHDTTRED